MNEQPVSGGEIVLFFASLASAPLLWAAIASYLRIASVPAVARHALAAAASACAWFFVMVIGILSPIPGAIGIAAIGASIAAVVFSARYARRALGRTNSALGTLIPPPRTSPLQPVAGSCSAHPTPIVPRPARSEQRQPPPLPSTNGKPRGRKPAEALQTLRPAPIHNVAFEYRDAEGARSYREVSIRIIEADRFTAYCHAREGVRTFLFNRIRGEIIDTDTGECVRLKRWRAGLQ